MTRLHYRAADYDGAVFVGQIKSASENAELIELAAWVSVLIAARATQK